MKPAPFDYYAPDSIDAALELMAEHGPEAKILAGGQSLIPSMNFRLIQPAVIVDLNRIPALATLEEGPNGGLHLGAMTRQSRLEGNPLIAERAPLLAETIPHVAHPQIRNRGTVGGSLAHADPAAELPVIAVALDMRCQVRRRGRSRWVAAADFFQGMFTVDLAPEEMLTAVEIPAWSAGRGWAFVEVARRHGDYALVGVAALVDLAADGRCRSARLVYLNVGDGPVDARQAAGLLAGERLTDEVIAAAAETAVTQEIDPVGNVHATADFQRHLARVLTRRALLTAAERARPA